MKYIKIFIFQLIWIFGLQAQSPTYTISGQIRDGATGEDLIGAAVYIPSLETGAVTNVYGFYSLTVPSGSIDIVYSYLGYESRTVKIELTENTKRDIDLSENFEVAGEVVIVAEKEDEDQNVESTEMSTINVGIETVKKMPALFGEVDIIKAIQLLPGVKTVGEGSSGFYVRGGNVDQNLVLLDEAPIYNASHLLGFFSSFNPDAIKDMQLYKGAIPAHYGGRLSSVLDIRMKEGNSKRFAASGGIGTVMSRLAVEAPIGDRGSFMLAGRRSYLDVLSKLYFSLRNDNSADGDQFYFYDLNAKGNYRINENNRIFLSGYFGKDVIKSSAEGVSINWGNSTATARWNHIFSPKLFSNLTYYYSNYSYFLGFDEAISDFNWNSTLEEHSLKADFGAFINPRNTVKFGIHAIQHNISPGDIKSFENDELVNELVIQSDLTYENALYLSHTYQPNDRLKIEYGLRLSNSLNTGPKEVYNMNDQYEVVDTTYHSSGIFNTYWNLEPRIGMRYKLNDRTSIKASYNRTTQYIQLASNGNSATPFDIWFSSTEHVKPQKADQYAIGIFKNLNDNAVELSAEIYYKSFIDAIDFKDHAQLLLNKNLEGELRFGVGRAYGLEILAKKNKGKLTGWVGYTYSKAEKKIDEINNGRWYNAKYDKPHEVSVVASYELSNRLSIGGNFVYSTGSAVTFPTGRYEFLGVAVPVYSERNGERLPDYNRLDLSATLRAKKNANRRFQSEWVLSVYNVYNRKNAFSIDFKQRDVASNTTFAEKTSIFSIVPSITYNAKF